MREKIIRFFIKRHLLANLIFAGIFVSGIVAWNCIPKEELPDVTFNTVRVSVGYPGAAAEEVEYYVTRPIEEALRGLDGIHKITSSTGTGNCSIRVEIERNYTDTDEAITEIRNAVLDVDLPDDITDDPRIRVFKTSRKAIIDIGLILKGESILDVSSREMLQTHALALENKLLSMPQISSVSRSGYLKSEIHIKIYPEKLIEYQIPLNSVINELQKNNVRQPAGNVASIKEPKVTLYGELDSLPELKSFAVQGGFEGQVVRLQEIADVVQGFEKTKSVRKINGCEGIFLRVTKSSSVGIIEAVKAVNKVVAGFQAQDDDNGDVEIVLLDDESYDVHNRLSLIARNGAIGFILILIVLFVFLDLRSGLWVAMGIPFTFCFALLATWMAGYSINNVTLAAVIIVMGMVVDDAIVVSENITRMRMQGVPAEEAAVKGTSFVFLPIVGSILTTCVAFLPLMFFTGHFGAMVGFIPPIVFFMLGGSLFEALFILPGHMMLPVERFFYSIINKLKSIFGSKTINRSQHVPKVTLRAPFCLSETEEGVAARGTISTTHWFDSWEDKYGRMIERILHWKWIVFTLFVVLLVLSGYVASSQMKFVMFPGEETREIRLTAETPPGTQRYETARLAQQIEDVITPYIGKEVIGFRTDIATSRRGSAAQENKLRMRIEIVPKEERKKSADMLIKEWKRKFVSFKNINKLRFSKTWHGQDSSSPVEILIKENNDNLRRKVVDELAVIMEKHPALTNVEIDRPLLNPEYQIKLNRDKIRRLAISPDDIAKTLRAALEGKILYDFAGDDEEVYVRITTVENAKDDIEKVLSIPVENQGRYLVPLKDVVIVEQISKPDSLVRENLKRTTSVYADLLPDSEQTPLDIADYFENQVFGKLTKQQPSTILEFGGEVKDTRESSRDFTLAIVLALALIYIILALLFDSLFKPLIIMMAIPFGIVGIIMAFWIHGISLYGFFAVIGAIGLAGVVVNDAIIMLTKLDSEFDYSLPRESIKHCIAQIAKTRLRAVILTTITTVVAIIPTAYGWAGFDAMLAQMMMALAWGLLFGTVITLVLIPCLYNLIKELRFKHT